MNYTDGETVKMVGTFGEVTLRYIADRIKATGNPLFCGLIENEPAHFIASMTFPGNSLPNFASGITAAGALGALYADYAAVTAMSDADKLDFC